MSEIKTEINFSEEPNGELIKEIYAQFGLAYYESECLHKELCNIFAIGSFTNREDITGPRVEEKMAHAFSLTLGEIVDALKDILPNELFMRLKSAVEKRNFLAHHFWFERAHLMHTSAGLYWMLKELSEFSEVIQRT